MHIHTYTLTHLHTHTYLPLKECPKILLQIHVWGKRTEEWPQKMTQNSTTDQLAHRGCRVNIVGGVPVQANFCLWFWLPKSCLFSIWRGKNRKCSLAKIVCLELWKLNINAFVGLALAVWFAWLYTWSLYLVLSVCFVLSNLSGGKCLC